MYQNFYKAMGFYQKVIHKVLNQVTKYHIYLSILYLLKVKETYIMEFLLKLLNNININIPLKTYLGGIFTANPKSATLYVFYLIKILSG